MSPRRNKPRISDPFGTLESLRAIAYDCWFSWNEIGQRPFSTLSPVLWEATKHSPAGVLEEIDPAVLEAKLADEGFRRLVADAADARRAYYETASWFEEKHGADCEGLRIAYFSSEFAIHESMQQYAGGLGVLAGDHLKSASDLGIPLVGVGLLYRQGYYLQELRGDGSTRVLHPTTTSPAGRSSTPACSSTARSAASRCAPRSGSCRWAASRSTCSTPTCRRTAAATAC